MRIKLFLAVLFAVVVGFGACGGGGGDDEPKSSECKITSFTTNDGKVWVIAESGNTGTVTGTYAKGATLPTSVSATIAISPKASIVPTDATSPKDYTTNDKTYTVTAEDGTSRVYTVKVIQSQQ